MSCCAGDLELRHTSIFTAFSRFDPDIQHLVIMAEAFSLAVNIITILDIGRKFAILAWDIYNDDKNGIPGIASLELTSKDLDENARQLKQLGSSPAAYSHDQTDERIRQLAVKCAEVAVQIQETLSGISTSKKIGNKRGAVMKVFKYKWKENDIKAFQMEIEELRDELILNLVVFLRFVSLSQYSRRIPESVLDADHLD